MRDRMATTNHVPRMALCQFIITDIKAMHVFGCKRRENLMNFGGPVRGVKFEGQEHVSTISISGKIIPINEFCNFAGMDD